MTTAFCAGIVVSGFWKAGPTFILSANRQLLTLKICRLSVRQRAAPEATTEASCDFLGSDNALESPRQFFVLFGDLTGQTIAKFAEKLLRIFHFRIPVFRVHAQ